MFGLEWRRFSSMNWADRSSQLSRWLAVGVAASLPWSASAAAISIALWVISALPVLRYSQLKNDVLSLADGLPILLWLIAALAMVWADVTWSESLHALGGFHKLLVLPLVLRCFISRDEAFKPLIAFLASCTVLLAVSWIFVLWPTLTWQFARFPGVPVKDFQSQSGEFVICAFALMHYGVQEVVCRRYRRAAILFGWAILFASNVLYVATGRTELVAIPILLAVFGFQWGRWKGVTWFAGAALLVGLALWFSSPHFREKLTGIPREIELAMNNQSERIAFYTKSIQFIRQHPIVGNGTGSMPELFRQSIINQTGAKAIMTVNPHNQILGVAIQLGILGTIVLLAMWAAHLTMFARGGFLECIGMLFVLQNIISNQFNSHLFDFTQGWTYVFGIGILGGPILHARKQAAGPPPSG